MKIKIYIKIPKAHQSDSKPWPLFSNTSGARYSGVPHNENSSSSSYINFAIPKSAKTTYPFESIKTFSGFKSL